MMLLEKSRLSWVRGWGPIRKLLLERESSSGCITQQEKTLIPCLCSCQSLQNLINSKPRLLFFFFYLKVSLILNTRTCASPTEQAEMSHPLKWTVNLDWARWCHHARSNRLKCSKWKTAGFPRLWEPFAGHCVSKQFSVSLLAWPQTRPQLWLQYQGVASWLFTVKLLGSRVTAL